MDRLEEDSLAQIVSFLDFDTAVTWVENVEKSVLHERFHKTESGSLLQTWKDFFYRQAFVGLPADEDEDEDGSQEITVAGSCSSSGRTIKSSHHATPSTIPTIIQEVQYRQQFQQCLNLGKPLSQSAPMQVAQRLVRGLPDRCFAFRPIWPDWEDVDFWPNSDPPPVHLSCDSFLLPSVALGEELLLLNPFTNSFILFSSVFDPMSTASAHLEESMTTQASISNSQTQEPTLIQYPWFHQLDQCGKPKQILIASDDNVLDTELIDFFWEHAPHRRRRRQRTPPAVRLRSNVFINNDQDDGVEDEDEVEVEFDYIGIDAKPILNEKGCITGRTMITTGRSIGTDNGPVCFEALIWFCDREYTIESFKLCRFVGDYAWIELCGITQRVYVVTMSTREQHGAAQSFGSNYINVYPMVTYHKSINPKETSKEEPASSFCLPVCTIPCDHPITSLALCATGKQLIASTSTGHLLIWETHQFQLVQNVLLSELVTRTTDRDGTQLSPNALQTARAPVLSIYCPRAISIRDCGFCTLHWDPTHGSAVFVWQRNNIPSTSPCRDEWSVRAIVHLPLKARRVPVLHYDGRRLIVYGQDQIGLILLVYQVSSTAEHRAVNGWTRSTLQLDGGVYDIPHQQGGTGTACTTTENGNNSAVPPVIRFTNRIRHAALGGVDDDEPLRMTCNERFIVVNTKTGNLLSATNDATFASGDGLLVIDLAKGVSP